MKLYLTQPFTVWLMISLFIQENPVSIAGHMIIFIKQSTQSSFCIFDANLQAPIRFLDAIASLDWGYDSKSEVNKPCSVRNHRKMLSYLLDFWSCVDAIASVFLDWGFESKRLRIIEANN